MNALTKDTDFPELKALSNRLLDYHDVLEMAQSRRNALVQERQRLLAHWQPRLGQMKAELAKYEAESGDMYLPSDEDERIKKLESLLDAIEAVNPDTMVADDLIDVIQLTTREEDLIRSGS